MDELCIADTQIRQLHARYADAVWRKDAEGLGNCFAPAAEWRISGRVLTGRQAITDFMGRAFGSFNRILMTFRTPIIDLGAEGASARTYVTEQVVLANGQGFATIGIYFDRFAIDDGHWRFSWRLFQAHYAGPADLSGSIHENVDFGRPPAMPPLDAPTYDRTGTLPDTGGS